jgi:hypothetical protein
MLTIPLEKLSYIIEKAREFDAEVPADVDEPGSNPDDDDEGEILFELRSAIEGLNTDEQEELLALIWLGRGDFTREEWPAAMRAARSARTGTEADYLIGTPLLADYLAEGLAALDLSLDE